MAGNCPNARAIRHVWALALPVLECQ